MRYRALDNPNCVTQYDQINVAIRYKVVLRSITFFWQDRIDFGHIWNQWEEAAIETVKLNGNATRYFGNLVIEANVKILDYLTRLLFANKADFAEDQFGELNRLITGGYILIYRSSYNSKDLSLVYRRILQEIQDTTSRKGGNEK